MNNTEPLAKILYNYAKQLIRINRIFVKDIESTGAKYGWKWCQSHPVREQKKYFGPDIINN